MSSKYAYNSYKRSYCQKHKKRYAAAAIASAFLAATAAVFRSGWFNLLMFCLGFACAFIVCSVSLQKAIANQPAKIQEISKLELLIEKQKQLDAEKTKLDKEIKEALDQQKLDTMLSVYQ